MAESVEKQEDDDKGFVSDLELDEEKLTSATKSDQGEVFLLRWLAKAEVALQKLTIDHLLTLQSDIEKRLLFLVCAFEPSILTHSSNSSDSNSVAKSLQDEHRIPRLGRPSRHLIARCLITLFQRGETKSLYDVLNKLNSIAGAESKTDPQPEKESKVGALYIAGELFLAVGHNVMSQFVALITLCQKLAKNTYNPVIIRYHALSCLSKVLQTGGKSLNEQLSKDILKTLRASLTDRAGAVARASASCLESLLGSTMYISSRSEIESLVSIAIKSMETADFSTMKALSRLCACLLAHTQKEDVFTSKPVMAKKKSKKAGQDESSDDEAGPSTPSATSDGAMRTLMSPKTMLEQLSAPLLRASTTKRGRNALLDVYATLLDHLGPTWVLSHYDVLIKHLLDDIPNHTRGIGNDSDSFSIRHGVAIILRNVIGERMLHESFQVGAVEELSRTFLKRWPVLMPSAHPPSKISLTLAFNEVSSLLVQLGSAPPQVLDAVQEPVMRCLAHPSHSVQVSAAWCLRTLCYINPSSLNDRIEFAHAELKRDIESLRTAGERGGADLPKRTVGHARGLAALISVIHLRPLYTSFDFNGKALQIAMQLLKNSADHSLPISAVEIQVAWILIGSLMSLGPNFTKAHVSQFLTMWKNALPKITDPRVSRSDAEWGFLLHVRECTLGCILSFLSYNLKSLVNLDTARRIISLLNNSLTFVNIFAAQHPTLAQEHTSRTERDALSLLDREHMVRRRIFQCFKILASNPALEGFQETLISASIQMFAEPDRYIGSATQAAISASAGNFSSIWHLADGYAYGVTSMLSDTDCLVAMEEDKSIDTRTYLNRDYIEAEINSLERRPTLGSAANDPLVLYTVEESRTIPTPAPSPTAVVDAAIGVFSSLLPYQRREVQISTFETLLMHTRSAKLEKNPARRMAVQVNTCVAILGTLRTAMQPQHSRSPSGFNNERLTAAIRAILLDALLQGDISLRAAASEAFGRLAAISGSQAMTSQVQMLVDKIVSSRDPDARAGCALAFGAVYREVGGLAAGPLTKTVVDILMSLATDPHPTVHYSALEGLRMVIEAASLSYSPYVASTLGMLVKLYMLSTHEPEGGSAGSVNLRADFPANQAVCRVINALVGVMGPELNEAVKVRTLVLVVLNEFSKEQDEGVIVEATAAMQHVVLFAPDHVDLAAWISSLQTRLKSKNKPVKCGAIDGFYQLIQRNALLVSKVCGNSLAEDLFELLDGDVATETVRQVLSNWLRQTADISPCSWIDLCRKVSRNSSLQAPVNKVISPSQQPQIGMLQDEEAASINLGDETSKVQSRQSRWRTRLFALQCLHEVLVTVKKAGKLEHFGTPRLSSHISSRVSDLIQMAFTASTTLNLAIRLEGLTILNDVIEYFRSARDPDFDEALLLEQHQAPIAAALTPAFNSDSTPEVLAKAVQVCAVFVGSGVVREVDKLGRILKLLTRALENCLEPTMTKLGEVEELSLNAAAVLKIAVFSAWAQLQVDVVRQPYLVEVIKPHTVKLATVWVTTLTEYAQLRADPDGSGLIMGPVVNPLLESPYAGLVRDVLLPHHQKSWHVILHAIAVLMSDHSEAVALAMEGEGKKAASPYRSEPAKFFYPLYGLAFEALATGSGSTREINVIRTTLIGIKFLCRPEYAGSLLLQDELFDELLNLSSRIVMTEGASIQICVLDLIASLTKTYGVRLIDMENTSMESNNNLLPESKLTKCLSLVISTLERATKKASVASVSSEERPVLIRSAYTAFCTIATLYSQRQQEQIFITGLYLYSEMLRDETSEVDLVGPTLASLREICIASLNVYNDALARSIHGFLSSCLNNLDSVRARTGPVAHNKSKNSLLAFVVVISSLPGNIVLSQPLLENFSDQLETRLRPPTDDSGFHISTVAINCIKTLVAAASRAEAHMGPVLSFCIGQTLAVLVDSLRRIHAHVLSQPNPMGFKLAEEMMGTLSGFPNVAHDNQRSHMLGIVLPVLVIFLRADHAQNSTSQCESAQDENEEIITRLQKLATQELLTLARQYPAAFRIVIELLPSTDRTLVELSVRQAVGMQTAHGNRADALGRNEGKSIELRSFG